MRLNIFEKLFLVTFLVLMSVATTYLAFYDGFKEQMLFIAIPSVVSAVYFIYEFKSGEKDEV